LWELLFDYIFPYINVDVDASNFPWFELSAALQRSVIMASERRRRTSEVHFIYDLPYFERKELCRILDVNNKWELLG